MKKKNLKYVGKAKSLYDTDDSRFLIMEFRNDISAFEGEKKAKLARKGEINNHFNAFIMRHLEANGISTQFVDIFSKNESVVKPLDMVRVECVVRNFAAGHLCSRLGIKEGLALDPPTFEFFLKDDERHDPMVNESLIRTFKWATDEEISLMKDQSFKINEILKPLFTKAGLLLVDFKLEFGRSEGQIVLGDEFTPDGCRIWDLQTREKMDKDRFRRDLGGVIEAYLQVAERMKIKLTEEGT